ncbi:MAG: UvrABC system protein A [Candidatus Heimdallarchaeota archaeon LC_3]|nr:MAG: UvrABC system protein A [Candidatus Heimdallarchaeota archaeon LC_3]
MSFERQIRIKGAQQHNLKIPELIIPRNKLVVISGVSGSGKSSLVFDTIFAEGQRRYMESLSSYARQFLGQMQKPKVDSIEGLSPAISIEQKTTSKNPRSTVATVSEIYDYLRLLYARIGRIFCYICGKEITKQSVSDIVERIQRFPKSTKIAIMGSIVSGRKGEFKDIFETLKKDGFARIRIDGHIYELENPPPLNKNLKHDIEVVVDRLIVGSLANRRLTDSVEQALKIGEGIIIVSVQEERDEFPKDHIFSLNFACVEDQVDFQELEPKMFSFNNPYGACPECSGLGSKLEVDPQLVLQDKKMSLREGALMNRAITEGSWRDTFWGNFSQFLGFSLDTPINKLTEKQVNAILYGTDAKIPFKWERMNNNSSSTYEGEWSPEGVVNSVKRRWKETTSEDARKHYEKFMRETLCTFCKGFRLHPKYQAVYVGGKGITEITNFSVGEAIAFINSLQLTEREVSISAEITKEIISRLGFLDSVGLSYLHLNRKSNTLSGGESQRIRLATQVGSALVGVLYVLDEPTIGLHERDKFRLVQTLESLRDIGNSVLVVEHDMATIIAADYIVDLGPGAGEHGGEVIATGTLPEIKSNPKSLTGKYIAGLIKVVKKGDNLTPNLDKILTIKGAKENNLKNITVDIPLYCLTVVTGVSGSGKSSLVNEVLYKNLEQYFYKTTNRPGKSDGIEGIEYISKCINVDQSPIGRTPRSNPATYTKLFDDIRDIFASTKEAKLRGYKKGRFSFNVRGGRCETCSGDGEVKIEMFFLPDVYIPCDKCNGARYNKETLEVHYKDKNIADILDMTVEEAYKFFENYPKAERILKTIKDVGLGYIKVGQPATTLSGGEAQRVKLARELSRSMGRTGKQVLYILDEPTTGLHSADVQYLLDVLIKLRDRGNSILLIEHNMEIIKNADWIIDLGPEGGDKGGKVIATGTPRDIIKSNTYTGQYLSKVLDKGKNYNKSVIYSTKTKKSKRAKVLG